MEVCTVGGFEFVGKNMTAVKVGEDVFIFDMGTHIPALIDLQDGRPQVYTEKQLRKAGAIPDDLVLDKLGWKNKVRAIFVGHAHLDHVGGVPYLAYRYPNAPIYASPFTMEVLNAITRDEKIRVNNKQIVMQENAKQVIKGQSGTYEIEFVHTTHSTIQCSSLALHTKEGVFFYAVDFKLDDTPVIENPPNYQRMKEIGKEGVKVLVINSLYSGSKGRTASESVARNLLEKAMASVNDKKSAFFITTFSSHIERLKSIVDFGKKTNRKIIFLGRSLDKYLNCSIRAKSAPSKENISTFRFVKQVNSILKEVERNRGKYLVVCTGHQAEERSILDRIVSGNTPFNFRQGDNIIFSSKIIPVPENILAREKMDERLRKLGVKIQDHVHVSGHGSEGDLKLMVTMLKPQQIIPTHGSPQQEMPMIRIAQGFGYEFRKNVHLSKDGKVLKF